MGRKKSCTMNYFDMVEVKEELTGKLIRKCKCKFCGKLLAYENPETEITSPSSPKNHLKHVHAIPLEKISSPFTSNTQKNLFDFDEPLSIKDIARVFCENSLPRSLFLNKRYRLAHKIPPKGTLGWSMKDFDNAIASMVEEITIQLKKSLELQLGHGEIDGWSVFDKNVYNLLVNGAVAHSEIYSKSEHVPNMLSFLKDQIHHVESTIGLLGSLTGDNTAKMDTPMALACYAMRIIHTRCVAHSLNLQIQFLFENIPLMKTMLAKIHIVTRLMRRKAYASKLTEVQRRRYGKSKKLPKIGETRWLCKLDAWQIFTENKEAIKEVLDDMPPILSDLQRLYLPKNNAQGDITDDDNSDGEEEEYDEFLERRRMEDVESSMKVQNTVTVSLSQFEFELLHNLNISIINYLSKWMRMVQMDRFSLLELISLWREMRHTAMCVQKWDVGKGDFISSLQNRIHVLSQYDSPQSYIQEILRKFWHHLDSKSNQFNDRLIAIGECLIPGLKVHSFENYQEILQCFFGNGQDPGDSFREDALWSMGPVMLMKLADAGILGLTKTMTLDNIKSQLLKEYGQYVARPESYMVYSPPQDPFGFWDTMVSTNTFPLLGRLAVFLLDVNVVNATVERSFKGSKKILSDDRNRLSLEKFERELKIKLNAFNLDNRLTRIKRIEILNLKFNANGPYSDKEEIEFLMNTSDNSCEATLTIANCRKVKSTDKDELDQGIQMIKEDKSKTNVSTSTTSSKKFKEIFGEEHLQQLGKREKGTRMKRMISEIEEIDDKQLDNSKEEDYAPKEKKQKKQIMTDIIKDDDRYCQSNCNSVGSSRNGLKCGWCNMWLTNDNCFPQADSPTKFGCRKCSFAEE